MPRTVVRHYAWNWDPLPLAENAAWSEEWTYGPDGALLSRRRLQRDRRRGAPPTVSTDPRAGAIMREELGLAAGRPMAGPHHH